MNPIKILLLGKNGQVGWELQRALQPLGEVLALGRETDQVSGLSGDVGNFDAIKQTVSQFKPNVVVNATAYTAVDQAESERDQADLINHLAVKHLAEQCVHHDALLVHYSTDYVFDGQGQTPWTEHDETAPVNAYGKTKRDGEVALAHSGARFINFRTCWVYGTHGHNFIKTMLKLAQSKESLTIIDDQRGVPTGAALIADVTAQVIRYYVLQDQAKQSSLHGHYHLAPQGETSWYDYAQLIFAYARQQGQPLMLKNASPIKTSDYPTPAQRPLNSRLNTKKLRSTFHLHLPNWQVGVEHVLGELLP